MPEINLFCNLIESDTGESDERDIDLAWPKCG